jgi:catechol 2,3-dioxygenase-like lactoylglutathione lyase family enzyme
MTEKTLAQSVFQIGYVVPDLKAAVAFFKEKLGVPHFMVVEKIHLSDQTYRGKPSDVTSAIAFGYLGDMQIELIQPISGESTYTEFLAKNPAGGVQHLGVMVEDFDKAVADMKAKGFPLVQSGRNGETRLAYFATDPAIGTLTEIVYIHPPERGRFEDLKQRKA